MTDAESAKLAKQQQQGRLLRANSQRHSGSFKGVTVPLLGRQYSGRGAERYAAAAATGVDSGSEDGDLESGPVHQVGSGTMKTLCADDEESISFSQDATEASATAHQQAIFIAFCTADNADQSQVCILVALLPGDTPCCR